MLEAGFTRVGEFHYLHHDISGTPYGNIGELAERIVSSAKDSGIGLTLLPVFLCTFQVSGGQAPDSGQRRFVNSVDRFGRLMDASAQAVAAYEEASLGVAHAFAACRHAG